LYENVREQSFSKNVQTVFGAHPASCSMGTGVLPGHKWPQLGFDHSGAPCAEVKSECRYTITLSYMPSCLRERDYLEETGVEGG
jgi:hypothetical protein